MDVGRRVRFAGSNGKAVQAIERFRPPAVEHRQIERAVQHHFLPAGAACLERTARVVEPDVDALHQPPPDVDVVVFDEEQLAGKARIAHQPRNLLQHFLARPIVRMRLAGEDELHRHLRVVDKL